MTPPDESGTAALRAAAAGIAQDALARFAQCELRLSGALVVAAAGASAPGWRGAAADAYRTQLADVLARASVARALVAEQRALAAALASA